VHHVCLSRHNSNTQGFFSAGSGRGIGYHTARLLSLLGAEVYVTDLCAAAIAAAVADIKALQPRHGPDVLKLILARLICGVQPVDFLLHQLTARKQCSQAMFTCCRGGAHAAPAMDLGSLRSIEQFVEEFSSQLGGAPLHTLVNNAGANFMGRDPWYTAAGVAGIPQVLAVNERLCMCPASATSAWRS